MDQLEFTWRPSVPGCETRARSRSSGCWMERREMWAWQGCLCFQLSGWKPDAPGPRVFIITGLLFLCGRESKWSLMHELTHLLTEVTRGGPLVGQGEPFFPLVLGAAVPDEGSGNPSQMCYKVLLQRWGHSATPEASLAWSWVDRILIIWTFWRCASLFLPFRSIWPVESYVGSIVSLCLLLCLLPSSLSHYHYPSHTF